MKNLLALLNDANDTFVNNLPEYQKQLKKIKNATTYKDLLAINGTERTQDRLAQLSIDPEDGLGLERIIGKNNLMDISFLTKGLEIAKTVCRIIMFDGQNKQPYGTGFLIGEGGLLMTNNHVVNNKNLARRMIAEFEYEKNNKGAIGTSYFFKLNPEVFFITNSQLDYTVVALEPIASNDPEKHIKSYGYNKLALSSNRVLEGETVSIIQHPMGLPKMIAIRENRVVELKAPHIHYTTDTQQGSSGSLVANDQWEIVALHRSGVPERDKKGRIKLTKGGFYKDKYDEPFINWVANQGVLMDNILKDIAAKPVKNKKQEIKDKLLRYYQPEVSENDYKLPNR